MVLPLVERLDALEVATAKRQVVHLLAVTLLFNICSNTVPLQLHAVLPYTPIGLLLIFLIHCYALMGTYSTQFLLSTL